MQGKFSYSKLEEFSQLLLRRLGPFNSSAGSVDLFSR